MTNSEKEIFKIRFDDLAPSLQSKIGAMVSIDDYDNTVKQFKNLQGLIGDITITIGYNKPTTALAMKNLHFNSSNILPSATNSTPIWQDYVMELGTNYTYGKTWNLK